MIRKIGLAAAGLLMGITVLPGASLARPLGTVGWMPFFGLPYPYGYVYHRPRMECYSIQEVDTPEGARIEEVWTCGGPVRARY